MKRHLILGIVATMFIAGCAETVVTRMDARTMQISTSAAPACGRTGAIAITQKAAAIETIRAGYDKFVLGGVQSQNNVRTQTTFGYSPAIGFYPQTTVGGTQDNDVIVTMFRAGEA